MILLVFGAGFGMWPVAWVSAREGVVTPAGTVMLSALPVKMGLQLVLAFLAYDIASLP